MNLFRQSQRPQLRQQVSEIRTPKIGKRRITNLRTPHPIIQLAIQMRGDMPLFADKRLVKVAFYFKLRFNAITRYNQFIPGISASPRNPIRV